MKSGTHGIYYWIEIYDTNFGVFEFLRDFKSFLISKHICITAFDSGPLILGKEDIINGWYNIDEIAISPKVLDETFIPHAGFDEWYIFENISNEIRISDIYVNYAELPFDKESSLLKIFWNDLEKNLPDIYLSEGTNFKIVTKQSELIERLKKHWC